MHFKTRKKFVSINDADLWPFTSRLSNTLVLTPDSTYLNIHRAKTQDEKETRSFIHSFIWCLLDGMWWEPIIIPWTSEKKRDEKAIQRQKVLYIFCLNTRLLAILLLILYQKYIYIFYLKQNKWRYEFILNFSSFPTDEDKYMTGWLPYKKNKQQIYQNIFWNLREENDEAVRMFKAAVDLVLGWKIPWSPRALKTIL